MKVSDYIANFLSKHTDYAYGGQGSSVIHFIDSFKKNKKINFISGQSEQGSSIAADAYHRWKGLSGHKGGCFQIWWCADIALQYNSKLKDKDSLLQ